LYKGESENKSSSLEPKVNAGENEVQIILSGDERGIDVEDAKLPEPQHVHSVDHTMREISHSHHSSDNSTSIE